MFGSADWLPNANPAWIQLFFLSSNLEIFRFAWIGADPLPPPEGVSKNKSTNFKPPNSDEIYREVKLFK